MIAGFATTINQVITFILNIHKYPFGTENSAVARHLHNQSTLFGANLWTEEEANGQSGIHFAMKTPGKYMRADTRKLQVTLTKRPIT